jgi:hypothetical protein
MANGNSKTLSLVQQGRGWEEKGETRAQRALWCFGLLAVAGFRPGGRPTFFLSRQKESRQRKRRFLFGQPAPDARPSGPLAPVWRLEALARSTEQPTAKPQCAELVFPSAGEPAQGLVVQRAETSVRPNVASGPQGAYPNELATFQGLFLCLLSFWPPKKKVGRPPGRNPATASTPQKNSRP